MNDEIRAAISCALEGRDLSSTEAQRAIGAIMDGRCSEVEIAALLTALRVKGEAVEEIVGSAVAMHDRSTKIVPQSRPLLDTCGTGGDELKTFNISTAAALVVAAIGVPVAKHGNRSVSSSSGSADVLEALGVNVELSPEQVARSVDEVGIGFCFAPLLHGAMKYAAPVRKQLGFRTIFNLLGPLTNPASAEYQLLGVGQLETAEKLARALAQLGRKRAMVVCGNGELDEVSLWGETRVFEVVGETTTVKEWTAETFGLPSCAASDLTVNSPEQSAGVIRDIFAGETGAPRDMVLANAAAALVVANKFEDPKEAVSAAASVIDEGKVAVLCERLVEFTQKCAG